jgi:hypothetical protein
MIDMIEEYELLQQRMTKDFNKLLAEHTREVELLLTELRELIAAYRELLASVPAQTETDDELARERAIAFARAVQRDSDERTN